MATKPSRADIRKHAETALANRGINPPDPQSPSFEAKSRGYEEKLERQLTNSEIFLARVYERNQAQEDDEDQRAANSRAELETSLTAAYMASAPGTSEAEAKAALPDLLHRHRLGQQDRDAEALDRARRRNRI
jgi:hypothetical protein